MMKQSAREGRLFMYYTEMQRAAARGTAAAMKISFLSQNSITFRGIYAIIMRTEQL